MTWQRLVCQLSCVINDIIHQCISLPAAGKKRRHTEEISSTGRKLPCLSPPQPQTSSEPPLVLMYRPVVANPRAQLMSSATVLQPHTSRPVNSSAYTVVAAVPQESSPQSTIALPQVSTSHPRTATSLILTSSPHILSSVPRIITSAPPTTPSPLPSHSTLTTATPTVVNGLLHLKPKEMKPVQVMKSSSEVKKPAMDISCLTKEGVTRNHAQTPPPLLQIQNRKSERVPMQSPLTESSQDQPLTTSEEDRSPVTPPPSGLQQLMVIREGGPQPRMVLPVAYDQQLVSMPIYRVGSSLGGLQPVQVLPSLPTGGSATT